MSSFLSAIILSTLSQITPFGPRCSPPPAGANAACVECYDLACETWFEEFYNCDGNRQCVETARRTYNDSLALCNCTPAARKIVAMLTPSTADDVIRILGCRFGK